MSTFEKTIHKPITRRKMQFLAAMTGTLNASKVGRNRRGTLLLFGGEGNSRRMIVRWVKAGQQCHKFVKAAIPGIGVKRFQIYDFADHGKLLKVLKA